jgi:RNA polymerase sigma-70 factor, ECF subfamily
MIDAEEKRLVERCLNGDQKAFESIIDTYKKAIFNSIYRMIRRFDDAQEITQKVFIKVFENLKSFKSSYKLFSWIYRIAINETLNYIHQQKHFNGLSDDLVDGNSPERDYVNQELEEKLQDALMELDPQHRILILLKHFQSFSYKEIAEILEIPEQKVKSRLFTARQCLKDILIRMEIISND